MIWNVMQALFFTAWTFAVYAYGEWRGGLRVLRGVRRMVDDTLAVQKDVMRTVDDANEVVDDTKKTVAEVRKLLEKTEGR